VVRAAALAGEAAHALRLQHQGVRQVKALVVEGVLKAAHWLQAKRGVLRHACGNSAPNEAPHVSSGGHWIVANHRESIPNQSLLS
jgi:hypothetical protein